MLALLDRLLSLRERQPKGPINYAELRKKGVENTENISYYVSKSGSITADLLPFRNEEDFYLVQQYLVNVQGAEKTNEMDWYDHVIALFDLNGVNFGLNFEYSGVELYGNTPESLDLVVKIVSDIDRRISETGKLI